MLSLHCFVTATDMAGSITHNPGPIIQRRTYFFKSYQNRDFFLNSISLTIFSGLNSFGNGEGSTFIIRVSSRNNIVQTIPKIFEIK